MWILPFVLGAVTAGRPSAFTALMFGACLLAFAARTALGTAVRFRARNRELSNRFIAVGFVEILAMFGLLSPILLTGNYFIVNIGLCAAALFLADLWWIKMRFERNVFIELLGVAGFALAAPAAYVVSNGEWRAEAFVVWLVSFLFFSGSVFLVKLRLRRLSPIRRADNRGSQVAGWQAVGYVIVTFGASLWLSLSGYASLWLLAAYVPWMAYILKVVFDRGRCNIYRLGWRLVLHSIFFTFIVAFLLAAK